jgi:signal transduction histidine kinase
MDEAQPELQSRTSHQREWAVLMHELRTPLTVLFGRVQLLRRHVQRGDDVVRIDTDLEAIEAAIVRQTAVVERLDRDSRADRGAVGESPPDRKMTSVISLLRQLDSQWPAANSRHPHARVEPAVNQIDDQVSQTDQ